MMGCNLFPWTEEEDSVEISAQCDSLGDVTPKRATLKEGNARFEPIPDEGCVLDHVTLGTKTIEPSADNSVTVSYEEAYAIGKKVELKFHFKKINTFEFSFIPAIGGTIDPSGKRNLKENEKIKVSMTPDATHNLVGFILNGDTSRFAKAISTTFSMDLYADKSYEVKPLFEPKKLFTVSVSSNEGGSTFPVNGKTEVVEGNSLLATSFPSEGYEIISQTVDGVPVVPPTSSYNFVNVSSDHSISWEFEKDPIMWPLLRIKWKLAGFYIDGSYTSMPDGDILDFSSNGTYTRYYDNYTSTRSWSIDRTKSPATIKIIYGEMNIESINDKEMRLLIPDNNGQGQKCLYWYKNCGYK